MMKTIKTFFTGLAAVCILSGIISCERVDYPDRHVIADGTPVVHYVRSTTSDALMEKGYLNDVVCLVGDNLNSVVELWFNDQQATLNTSYMTDHTLIAAIPKTSPVVQTDQIYLITPKDTVSFPFVVLLPAPVVTSMKNEYANIGETAVIYGEYFIKVQNVKIGTTVITDFKATESSVSFTVPDGLNPDTAISIETESGTGFASFRYMDQHGTLFDFDGKTGLGADHGWHARVITTDDTAVSGNYVRLGDGDVELTNWNDGQFSFEYWCGSWDTPQNITKAPDIALFNLVDFSNFANMSLKFEMCIPSDNPWCDFPMQIAFQGIDQVTLSGYPVIGFDKVGGPNATIFNGDDALGTYGRAHYSPWAATGSFHTNGEWITVTIPLSKFNLDKDGKDAAFKATKATDFGSLTMFITGASTTGTVCKPLIKIDNIRVVNN